MSLLDYLRRRKKPTASMAKERLQIILAREHADISSHEPDYLPALKRELLEVVSKYVKVNLEDIKVNLEKDGTCEILELNIALPDERKKLNIN